MVEVKDMKVLPKVPLAEYLAGRESVPAHVLSPELEPVSYTHLAIEGDGTAAVARSGDDLELVVAELDDLFIFEESARCV